MQTPDGNAIVYCDEAFGTLTGKTAHGLVRRTERYLVLSVIDRLSAGKDAGEALDGKTKGIPVVADLKAALAEAKARDLQPTHFVIGLAPDGGRLPAGGRAVVREALAAGLNVDSGLHDFLSDDPELIALANAKGVKLRDVRKTPPRSELHSFTGRIESVEAIRIALLGTDSAVGKRTTAWLLVEGLRAAGFTAEMIGTGQTAWMQGVRHGVILDSLINDFVAGELENAAISCWNELHPQVIVIEGQGSLMNPAYPGGLEILASTRPHFIVLQHAPHRREYDGFPGYAIHPLDVQIKALELVSGRPVAAVALNHEGYRREEVSAICEDLARQYHLPVVDPLVEGGGKLVAALRPRLGART